MIALQYSWFALLFVLLAGYTVLDGFDLGVGFWSLFARNEGTRRTMINAIGPFWDGNEVWLLTAGGALFAAFPPVYASVFSGLYLALMLVLCGLILRAVAIEFRAREWTPQLRAGWDAAFALGSILPILLFGVAFGNILRGLPLDAQGNYTGTFFTLLNPFALLVGLCNVAMLATHGALYLVMRTEGELASRAHVWARSAWHVFFPLVLLVILAAALTQPHLLANYRTLPVLWLLPLLALAATTLTRYWYRRHRARHAFAASSAAIVLLLVSAAAALFPTLAPALGHPAWNLTATNSSSSPLTLQVMLVLALLGMTLVIAYTIWVYRMFSGVVKEEGEY